MMNKTWNLGKYQLRINPTIDNLCLITVYKNDPGWIVQEDNVLLNTAVEHGLDIIEAIEGRVYTQTYLVMVSGEVVSVELRPQDHIGDLKIEVLKKYKNYSVKEALEKYGSWNAYIVQGDYLLDHKEVALYFYDKDLIRLLHKPGIAG